MIPYTYASPISLYLRSGTSRIIYGTCAPRGMHIISPGCVRPGHSPAYPYAERNGRLSYMDNIMSMYETKANPKFDCSGLDSRAALFICTLAEEEAIVALVICATSFRSLSPMGIRHAASICLSELYLVPLMKFSISANRISLAL